MSANILSEVRVERLDMFTQEGVSFRCKYMQGFVILKEIIRHPYYEVPHLLLLGKTFSMREITDDLLPGTGFDDEKRTGDFFNIGYCENGILMTDRDTIRKCFDRINYLNTMKSYLNTKNDRRRVKERKIEKELNAIWEYLRETCIIKNGALKFSKSEMDVIYNSFNVSVWRAINEIRAKDLETAVVLKRCIRIEYAHSLYIPDDEVDVVVRAATQNDKC